MSGVRVLAAADLPQGTPAWHALRRVRVGSSETPVIGRLCPYGHQGAIWATKRGAPPERRRADLYLRVGHALEPLLRELVAEEAGEPLAPGDVLVEERGLLLASEDGRVGGVPVECKVRFAGNPDYPLWTAETAPGHVVVQLTQAALLRERAEGRRFDAARIGVLLADRWGLKYCGYRVELTPERRDEWADLWRPTVEGWWRRHVLGGEPPPDAEHQDVAVLVEPTRVVRRDASDDEARLVADLAAADAARAEADRAARAATKARDALRDELARRLGPDHTIPGVQWRTRGKHTHLTLEDR